MKTTISTIALCLGFTILNAQAVKEAAVPSKVKDAFAKKYPGAKIEKWEKEDEGYEAEFKLNKEESSALFAEDGTFKEAEQEIKTAELPKGVSDYCAKNFAGYKLSEASKITEADGKIMYEAEMEKGKEHFDAIFDSKGAFVRKTEVSSKDEDKD